MACSFRYETLATDRGRHTDSLGITPSRFEFSLQEPPDADLPDTGTVTATDGTRTRTWVHCRLREAAPDRTVSGYSFRITVLDRRVWWAYAEPVTLEANPPDEGGALPDDDLMTLQELLAYLLDAMGEAGYELRSIPEEYPYVDWVAAAPHLELDRLCQAYGLVIALQSDAGNPVLICPRGQGAALPDEKASRRAWARTTVEIPEEIIVVGRRSRWQIQVLLEGVAWDPIDLAWKAVIPGDGDEALSYYDPDEGWTYDPYGSLKWDDSTTDIREKYAAAQSTLFRCYRIRAATVEFGRHDVAPGQDLTLYPVTYTREEVFRRMLPTIVDDFNTWEGRARKRQPYCVGRHATNRSLLDPAARVQSDEAEVSVPFRIDRRRGLVWFRQPVFEYSDAGTLIDAEISLVCAVEGPVSQYRIGTAGGMAGVVTTLRKDSFMYDYKHMDLLDITSAEAVNADDMSFRALSWAMTEYDRFLDVDAPETAAYPGVHPLGLDGAIRSVTTSVSTTTPPETTVSRGTEHGIVRSDQKRYYAASASVVRSHDLSVLAPPDEADLAPYETD